MWPWFDDWCVCTLVFPEPVDLQTVSTGTLFFPQQCIVISDPFSLNVLKGAKVCRLILCMAGHDGNINVDVFVQVVYCTT